MLLFENLDEIRLFHYRHKKKLQKQYIKYVSISNYIRVYINLSKLFQNENSSLSLNPELFELTYIAC